MNNQYTNQPLELYQLPSLLSHVSAETDRTEWVKHLMAIKSEYGSTGKEYANDWSATASNYDPKAFNSTWNSIKQEGGITIATLVQEAINNGFKFAPIPKQDKQRLEEERKRVQAKNLKETLQQEKEQEKGQKSTAMKAYNLAVSAIACPFDFGYLVKKNIKPHEALYGEVIPNQKHLIIPIYGTKPPFNGLIQSLQYINEQGQKRFLKGGRKAGGYYPIQWIEEAPIIICEGFATGCTLAEHYTPFSSVICCFDAGNLDAVVKWFRFRYSRNEIIIAGDNDHQAERITGVNTGKTKALKIARKYKANVSIPVFKDHENGSDWNDRHNLDQQQNKAGGEV